MTSSTDVFVAGSEMAFCHTCMCGYHNVIMFNMTLRPCLVLVRTWSYHTESPTTISTWILNGSLITIRPVTLSNLQQNMIPVSWHITTASDEPTSFRIITGLTSFTMFGTSVWHTQVKIMLHREQKKKVQSCTDHFPKMITKIILQEINTKIWCLSILV